MYIAKQSNRKLKTVQQLFPDRPRFSELDIEIANVLRINIETLESVDRSSAQFQSAFDFAVRVFQIELEIKLNMVVQ